ncbi:Hypothetical predicted protein [Mytilus galloprovincialis]|uniref:Uncharacterized protein n=1 Tax=Mytilus galloprovincialis TaxID=29158 RepID=A0A8B6ELI8_MYTGA|nr:Hypothetical predicted protein [Mytilus galloprovincialis]
MSVYKSRADSGKNRFSRYTNSIPRGQAIYRFSTNTHPAVVLKRVASDNAVLLNLNCEWKDCYDSTNSGALDNLSTIYDEFRISRITWVFKLQSAQTVVDAASDDIVRLYNVYDPDSKGAAFADQYEILKVGGYRVRSMVPFQSYSVSLYPNYRTDVLSGPVGKRVTARSTLSGRWFDSDVIDQLQFTSRNCQQVVLGNLPVSVKKKTNVVMQKFVEYEFKGHRNGSVYGPAP